MNERCGRQRWMRRRSHLLSWSILVTGVVGSTFAYADRPMDRSLKATAADWLEKLENHDVAHYVVIGDSISFRADTWTWFLRNMLEQRFGVAGDGYLGFNGAFAFTNDGSINRRPGLKYRRSSNWAYSTTGAGARLPLGERSVDGLFTCIGATGWVEVEIFGPKATLHFVREQGAGTLRIQVNGAWVADVDAASAESIPSLGVYTFSTGQSNPNVINRVRVSLVGATEENPQWTQVNGLFMSTGEPGPLFSRLARGGVGPEDFLRCDPGIFRDTLASLNPDLVIIMLDHDDIFIYADSMAMLLDRVDQAVPDAEILLVTHHHFGESRAYDADVLNDLAASRSHGYLNFFDLHRDFAHLHALGFLIDSVHFSAVGGAWFARQYDLALQGWTQPVSFGVDRGDLLGGELYQIRGSDDDALRIRSGFGSTFTDLHSMHARAEFVTDTPDPHALDLLIETSVNQPSGMLRVLVWNWRTNQFESVGQAPVNQTDEEIMIGGLSVADRVSTDGRVLVQVRHVVVAPVFAFRFDSLLDHVRARVR